MVSCIKVLHVCLVRKVAGAERHLLHLLPGLHAHEIDAQMLVLHEQAQPPSDFVDPLTAAGVPVHCLHIPPVRRKVVGPRVIAALVEGMRAQFRALKPDIAHMHLIIADLYGIPAARLAGVPRVVSTRHNLDAYRREIQWQLPMLALGRMTDKVIAVSGAVNILAQSAEHLPPEKVRTIYHGIELPRDIPPRVQLRRELGLAPETPLVGSVGRLIEQKGLIYGLEAFAQARQAVPDAHYVIAGDGGLRESLKESARQLGLDGSVHFLGWRSDTNAVFAALDVFLMPSLWDGFPIVSLEAMSYRLPMIGTNTGPTPEIIVDGETGYLVAPADSGALVEPLVHLLRDPALAKRMGEAGFCRMEAQFSLKQMVAQTAALYCGLF